ncbi:carboxylating nicotinate-nucleotide diphosphorylase [bacterium]|nr:carboxylating nicotinate-nucleotide diphosphorylase [bacterium]
MTVFELSQVDSLLRAALAEDIGRGDVTTRLTVPAGVQATGTLRAKQPGVLAGLPLVARVFGLISAAVRVEERMSDGAAFAAGAVLATVAGPAADLLVGERLALNLVQRLSGVATLTRRYVEAIAGTRARVIDTRKTTPGLRALEKHAVRMGGGANHRSGLDDGILIKDNHITAAGGVAAALQAARAGAPHGLRIEIECATLAQVDAALGGGADAILLDNMSVAELAAAVRHIGGRAIVEASGGVTLETIRAIAETGVDLISVGALTHSAAAVDISMKIAI